MAAPPVKTPRTCSQCGNNGHNARTCNEHGGASSGFMLFGVRVTAPETNSSSATSMLSSFRKSMSMNNLSQYEQQQQPLDSPTDVVDAASGGGYASDDAVHASSGSRGRERKRGVPWTEEEHMLFLMGLKKVGKGDWRGISRNFVKTRTPTQVASHAQKYFLRRTNFNRRRRRSSLFDITTDTVTNSASIEDHSLNQDSTSQSKPPAPTTTKQNGNVNICTFPNNPFRTTMLPTSTKQTRSIPQIPVPPSSKMANLNLNQAPSSSSTSTNSSRGRDSEPILSLKLSSTPSGEESVSHGPNFRGFKSNGDNIISVA